MTDANTAALREYQLRDKGDYSYSELLSEAKAYVTERLYNGDIFEMLDEISKNDEDYTSWLKLVGGALVNPRKDDTFFVSQFANIYMSLACDKLCERIDKNGGEL